MILLLLMILFSTYSHGKNYQEKKSLLARLAKLEKIIKLKDDELIRYQQTHQRIMKTKLKLENESLELSRQLKDALKNNQCTHELVPVSIANKLYSRAYQIRQAAIDAREFIK